MTRILNGQDLIDAGARSGAWFKAALAAGDAALGRGASFEEALALALSFQPPLPSTLPLSAPGELPFHVNLYPDTPEEEENAAAVKRAMRTLMRTPMVRAGAVMPDACPTGVEGSIPVGGVVLSEAIHPGMHSADVCCSVMMTIFREVDPAPLLEAIQAVTHFGPGGRAPGDQIQPEAGLLARFAENAFLKDQTRIATEHFGTQGDGNHFAYVGRLASSGETVLVTQASALREAARRRWRPASSASGRSSP